MLEAGARAWAFRENRIPLVFTTSEPTSPLFIGLLLAALLNIVLAWNGLVVAERLRE